MKLLTNFLIGMKSNDENMVDKAFEMFAAFVDTNGRIPGHEADYNIWLVSLRIVIKSIFRCIDVFCDFSYAECAHLRLVAGTQSLKLASAKRYEAALTPVQFRVIGRLLVVSSYDCLLRSTCSY